MRSLVVSASLALACVISRPALDTAVGQESIVDLGTLGGPFSSASAINNRGQIVGVSNTDPVTLRGFLWEEDAMTELGTLPGGHFSGASGINDRGQIAGTSTNELFEAARGDVGERTDRRSR
jgi:probable HAF family extracellular repeat protein